ncbi:hypothetical protein HU200_004634 [Digitaria exilis]|uniref:Uncharacterized protein n=1 Tax=Digitaria exilis TaxID=1010633 RepID=A0A835FP20_9POAL|nr:hypothetical protein HU200_007073 [Digitaria exilis]KAF8775233.1 hypothetical protein HU200_004634 [Digitaria exilis]
MMLHWLTPQHCMVTRSH